MTWTRTGPSLARKSGDRRAPAERGPGGRVAPGCGEHGSRDGEQHRPALVRRGPVRARQDGQRGLAGQLGMRRPAPSRIGPTSSPGSGWSRHLARPPATAKATAPRAAISRVSARPGTAPPDRCSTQASAPPQTRAAGNPATRRRTPLRHHCGVGTAPSVTRVRSSSAKASATARSSATTRSSQTASPSPAVRSSCHQSTATEQSPAAKTGCQRTARNRAGARACSCRLRCRSGELQCAGHQDERPQHAACRERRPPAPGVPQQCAARSQSAQRR